MSEVPTRLLAVDFGDRRTGLAATDPTGTIASPLPALVGLDNNACAQAIADVATDRDTQLIVVGLPLVDGAIGTRARQTLSFVDLLRRVAPCGVVTVDETHTTDEAHRRLKSGGMKAARRKRLADSVAALVILERYRAGQ